MPGPSAIANLPSLNVEISRSTPSPPVTRIVPFQGAIGTGRPRLHDRALGSGDHRPVDPGVGGRREVARPVASACREHQEDREEGEDPAHVVLTVASTAEVPAAVDRIYPPPYARGGASRRTGGSGSARRSRARSRRRTRRGSRTPRSAGPAAPSGCPSLRRSAATSSDAGLRAARFFSRYLSVRPESTMSSTSRTSRPSRSWSRSFRIRTTPEVFVAAPYDETAMKSNSSGRRDVAGEIGHHHERALQHADEQELASPRSPW